MYVSCNVCPKKHQVRRETEILTVVIFLFQMYETNEWSRGIVHFLHVNRRLRAQALTLHRVSVKHFLNYLDNPYVNNIYKILTETIGCTYWLKKTYLEVFAPLIFVTSLTSMFCSGLPHPPTTRLTYRFTPLSITLSKPEWPRAWSTDQAAVMTDYWLVITPGLLR